MANAAEGQEKIQARGGTMGDPHDSLTAASNELALAEAIARGAHRGQVEESTGDDYIRHVERVVALVDSPEAKTVAWLHDVIEDSPWTVENLLNNGISARVCLAVERLTRTPPYDNYQQYIENLRDAGDELALAVKLADLRDHLRPNCPARLRPRYERALQTLAPVAEPDVDPSWLPRVL